MPFTKGNSIWKNRRKKRIITKPLYIEKICLCGCGNKFKANRYRKGYILGHSQKITRQSMVGNKAPKWKGGMIYRRGYIFIYSPNHPNRDGYYVKRSRLTVEKKLGRFLLTTEIVHHINGIRDDDRIENLAIMTRSQHTSHHNSS